MKQSQLKWIRPNARRAASQMERNSRRLIGAGTNEQRPNEVKLLLADVPLCQLVHKPTHGCVLLVEAAKIRAYTSPEQFFHADRTPILNSLQKHISHVLFLG